jgi:hypothetical protein
MVVDVMAATKTAPVTRRARTVAVTEERFEAQGRAWLWREGASLVADRFRSLSEDARDEVRALFLRKLVPNAEKRGIAGEALAAATPSGVAAADVRWMRWFREGEDPAPLWALFVQSRVLSTSDADNDTWNLVAWGDGPALAWASRAPVAQECLRAALRSPPPWLFNGVGSRDAAFAVRIERATEAPRTRRSPSARRDATTREPASDAGDAGSNDGQGASAERPSARAILAAWRRTHPARSA